METLGRRYLENTARQMAHWKCDLSNNEDDDDDSGNSTDGGHEERANTSNSKQSVRLDTSGEDEDNHSKDNHTTTLGRLPIFSQ